MARVTPLGAWPLLDYLVLTTDSVGAGIHQLARYLRVTSSPVVITPGEDVEPIVIGTTAVSPFAVEYQCALITRVAGGDTRVQGPPPSIEPFGDGLV